MNHIHPDERDMVAKSFEDYLEGRKKEHVVEHRFRKKDQSYLWMQSNATITQFSKQGNRN